MKNLIICLISLIAISCSKDYEEYIPEPEPQDFDLHHYLDDAIKVAYDTHLWMSEEGECQELKCCWCYVPKYLQDKYEHGDNLTIEEKELIIAGIESSPSFLDTIGEGDEFYHLWCYQEYGPSYFEEYVDPDE